MSMMYSTDDEVYSHECLADVWDALDDDGLFAVGAIYYEVLTDPVHPTRYLDAEMLLEQADEWAVDDLGDYAEDMFSVSPDATQELKTLLSAWADKHITTAYQRCIGKTIKHTVTAEDVEVFTRETLARRTP